MMKIKLVCLTLLVLSMLPGCKSVVSDHLIGEPLEAEQARAYEGVWRAGDSTLHVKHLDGADLLVAGLEWEEGGFKLNQHHVVVTGHQDARFVLMVVEEEEGEDKPVDAAGGDEAGGDEAGGDAGDDKPWLLLGMLSASGDDALVLYDPNFERFKWALDEGKIQGDLSEDGNTLHIKGDKASLDALVNPETLLELFEVRNPGVMQRIGGLE